jgi:hypothetical protein
MRAINRLETKNWENPMFFSAKKNRHAKSIVVLVGTDHEGGFMLDPEQFDSLFRGGWGACIVSKSQQPGEKARQLLREVYRYVNLDSVCLRARYATTRSKMVLNYQYLFFQFNPIGCESVKDTPVVIRPSTLVRRGTHLTPAFVSALTEVLTMIEQEKPAVAA